MKLGHVNGTSIQGSCRSPIAAVIPLPLCAQLPVHAGSVAGLVILCTQQKPEPPVNLAGRSSTS